MLFQYTLLNDVPCHVACWDNCDNDNGDDVKIYSSHFFTIDKLLSVKMSESVHLRRL